MKQVISGLHGNKSIALWPLTNGDVLAWTKDITSISGRAPDDLPCADQEPKSQAAGSSTSQMPAQVYATIFGLQPSGMSQIQGHTIRLEEAYYGTPQKFSQWQDLA